MSWYLLIYTIGEWVIRVLMLPVITTRRRPDAAMAWLLLIFFLPWAGLALFLVIGRDRLPRWRRRQLREFMKQTDREAKRFVNHPAIVHPQLGTRFDSTVRVAERLSPLPILAGNDVEVLADTDETIDRMIRDIESARNHVHLLFYIFADDETGNRVIDALGGAVERGVRCRVLVDSVGSWKAWRSLWSKMHHRGIELHDMLSVSLYRRLRHRLARIDLRNHRKLAVIDGRVAYTGSQNIVNADYGHRNLAWHDLMVRVTGPVTVELQTIFAVDWYQETGERLQGEEIYVTPQLTGDVPAQTLPSGPTYDVESYQRLITSALHDAHERVIITTPYFVPDEPLLQAIQIAVWRGVRVDVIVPQRCDQAIVGAAARAYYEDVLDAGAALYLHTEGLLHSKTMTVDNSLAFLGSSNFDIRSFTINFELNMLLYGPDVTRRLRQQQLRYMAESVRLDADVWRQRPLARKTLDNVARLMSPLL